MRKFLVPLLMASALVPAVALAQDRDSNRGQRAHVERSSQREARSQERADRSERAERPQRAERSDNVERSRPERAERVERDRPQRADRADRPLRGDQVQAVPQPIQQAQAPQPAPSSTTSEGRKGGIVDAFRRVARGDTHDDHDGNNGGWKGDKDRDHDWKRDWRKDHRYDWYRYRSRYGSLYRLGRYYDPYGWGYNRWSIGYSLWPSYYGSNFWLNDPWMYRLPPAYGPYRWVRYYDDAILVNIYTGQVADVIHNFFW
jgi:hypothetical protein